MDVIVKHDEQLHQIMDDLSVTKGSLEDIKKDLDQRKIADEETVQLKTQVTQALEKQNVMWDRLERLDRSLGYGNKIYQPLVPAPTSMQQETRTELARLIVDMMHHKQYGRPKYDCDLWKRQQTTVVGEGGYTLPQPVVAEIIRITQTYGLARKLARVIRMDQDVVHLSYNTDLPTVYWEGQNPGALTITEILTPTMATNIETGVTIGRQTLNAQRMLALDTISLTLNADNPGMVDYTLERFGIAVSREEDFQYFISPGGATTANPFTGLAYTTVPSSLPQAALAGAAGEQNTVEKLLLTGPESGYNVLLNCQNAASPFTEVGAGWVMSKDILTMIRGITDSQYRPLWGEMSGGDPNQLFGYPIYRSEVMPARDALQVQTKPVLLFGNFRFHLFGDREQISMDLSTEAAFERFALVLRVTERVAFIPGLVAPFSVLKTGAN